MFCLILLCSKSVSICYLVVAHHQAVNGKIAYSAFQDNAAENTMGVFNP